MFTVLLVIYLLAALGVIGLVLIQQGKGADMGPHSVLALQTLCLVLVAQEISLPEWLQFLQLHFYP